MKVEIAIPCFNEELTISKVIADFRKALPDSEIIVYNNCSEDKTAENAKKAGAKIINVNSKGKGYVVREIFETSKADIVLMVDGDDTYEADDAHLLIEPLVSETADMTIGTRLHSDPAEFRLMHHFGNRLLTRILNMFFGTKFRDILSGYRAFNRRVIEKVPLISTGFEIETEIMLQSLENGISIKEIPIRFRKRQAGSLSKLSSFKDGYRIIITIISMLRDHHSFLLFSLAGLGLSFIGSIMWFTGFFSHQKSIILATVRNIGVLLIELSVGLFLVGFILNTINVRMRELSSLIKRKKQ